MNKRLRSPEKLFHCRQEKKFITSKDLDLASEEKMKRIYDKTRQILFDGANSAVLPDLNTNAGESENINSKICCSRFSTGFQVADANGNSEMSIGACSYCDRRVCNNCGLNCIKCYKLFCSHCCVPDYSYANTTHVCYTCYN